MQKKITSFIISLSLVFGAVAPCFAVDLASPSSISLKSVSFTSDAKATSPSTTVEPEDSSALRYYVNSNGAVTSTSTYINTWGNIVTDITYSLAYSADIIENRLLTLVNNLSSYLYSSATTGYYLWDWSSSNGVYQGSPTSVQSVISQLRAMGSSLTKLLSYNTEYTYQLYDLISNGGLLDTVKIADNTNNNFTYDYVWKKNYTQTNRTVPWINASGNVENMTINTQTRSILGYISLLADTINYSISYALPLISGNVRGDNDAIADLYNSDMTIYSTKRESLWQDLRIYLSNLSLHLSRLDYVLASDEEIAARQAAAANTDAVVDDFISSSGSASASTSDFADVASAGSAMKNALSSNVSPTNAFSSLSSSSNAWDWFSQATSDSLDSTSNTMRKGGSDTPMLDSYYDQLMETLRFK